MTSIDLPATRSHRGGHWFDPSIAHQVKRLPITGPAGAVHVDPTKFDFYAMDCYRMLADDKMAENLANEVIHASTDFDGRERAPMRLAEAHVTLGVVAARQGDVDTAVAEGERGHQATRGSPCHRS